MMLTASPLLIIAGSVLRGPLMAYANRAPRWVTILVSLVLVLVGILGTFIDLLPERLSVWSLVAATVLMVLGVFLRRL